MNRCLTGLLRTGLVRTWIVLVALTLATMVAGGEAGRSLGFAGAAAVVAFAVVKGRRILTDYMELNQAAGGWRAGLTVWLAVVGGAILAGHAAIVLGWAPIHRSF